MKNNTYEFPKSSFFGMAKDTAIIMEKILDNKNLLRLLRYNTPDCLTKPVPSGQEIYEMLNGVPDPDDPKEISKQSDPQISNVPKVDVSRSRLALSYLRVGFDSFTPNATDPFYRDHIVQFKIICHFDNWTLKGYELRPYRIAGELDAMFDRCKLTGIGVLNLLGADQDVYDNEYGGVTLRYLAVRGHEDDYKDDYKESPKAML